MYLQVLYNINSGNSLGSYSYHIAIWYKFPHLVKYYKYFNNSGFEKLEIWGFEVQDWVPDVKWTII